MITFKELEEQLDEAHKVGDKVLIHKGPADVKGKEGRIGEIRKGLYKGAPKSYTVDYDHHETTGERKSIQLKPTHFKAIKEDSVAEGLKPQHNMRPGWMLKADPELAKKVKANKELAKKRQASYGNPSAGVSVKEEHELFEGAYEKAEENKKSADSAKKQGDMFAHHLHMADHHDNMSQWHSEKGRHGEADKHAEKAEHHHEEAMKLKESVELDEARMTAAMKLQKAFQREQEKRESEKKAGEELLNKKTNEEVAANSVAAGGVAGFKGDAGKKAVEIKMLKRKALQPFKEFVENLEESKPGLWANIHAKRKRIKNGSGEKMRTPGSKGAPTAQDFKNSQEQVEAQFDMIEEMVELIALENNVDSEIVWEELESIDDNELLEYAIDKKGYKSSTGGLTQKGVDAYNRKTGGNLKTAVTTPPSKLKPGSKAAKRRKSFCARMSGVDGPMKKPNGEPTRKALALRKWNC